MKSRLAELHPVRPHAARHRLLQLGDGGSDRPGQPDGVGAGLLLDAQDDGRATIHTGIATANRAPKSTRHLAQQDGLALTEAHRCIAQILQ